MTHELARAFVAMVRECWKPTMLGTLVGCLLVWLCWPSQGLYYLVCFLLSFAASYVFVFRRPDVRPEFRGDR